MKNKHKLIAKSWLEKADKDLEVAELLLKRKKRFVDLSCFHLQQAFEKYLKALIAYNGVFPQKTHDLGKLLNQTAKYNLKLLKFIDAANHISPFAVIPRYPDEELNLPISSVKKLIKETKRLAVLIKEIISI